MITGGPDDFTMSPALYILADRVNVHEPLEPRCGASGHLTAFDDFNELGYEERSTSDVDIGYLASPTEAFEFKVAKNWSYPDSWFCVGSCDVEAECASVPGVI